MFKVTTSTGKEVLVTSGEKTMIGRASESHPVGTSHLLAYDPEFTMFVDVDQHDGVAAAID